MAERRFLVLFGCSIVALTIVLSSCTTTDGTEGRVAELVYERDITYVNRGTQSLKMDITRPASSTSRAPMLLFLHGGGFMEGTKAELHPVARMAAQRGYVAACVEYRLTSRFGQDKTSKEFPAALHDIKAAIRWLRENAQQFDGDPDRIGAVGFSAGATLAVLAAVTRPRDGLEGDDGPSDVSSQLQAAVAAAPIVDFTDAHVNSFPYAIDAHTRLFGGSLESSRERYKRGSSIQYFDPTDAPTLAIFGGIDTDIGKTQVDAYMKAAVSATAPHQIHYASGAKHSFFELSSPAAYFPMWAFLDQTLGRSPNGSGTI